MKPVKLSSRVFLELPPILASYVEAERNHWLEGVPFRGRITLLDRPGQFAELETLAVERRQLLDLLGLERGRAHFYLLGFEQGRRDAVRHLKAFDENTRLALQAGLVFAQLQGRFVAKPERFEFDLNENSLYRETALEHNLEAAVHRMAREHDLVCACWNTSGYIAGHTSEILGRRVLTLESECVATGTQQCRHISRLDQEWGEEADWVRQAFALESFDQGLRKRDEAIAHAQRAARKAQLALNDLNKKLRSEWPLETLVAESESMQTAVSRARSLATAEAPLLIHGENGTGKRAFALAIHRAGSLSGKVLVEVDCRGLAPEQVTHELFGDVRPDGSGGGAVARAAGGTLYISEIANLSQAAQGVLAGIIQDGYYTPLGASGPRKANIRIIAGSRHTPQELQGALGLREDLFYALSVSRLGLPPLRERGTDILRLIEFFMDHFRSKHGREQASLTMEAKRILVDFSWPGNVRQLRSAIEHAIILGEDDALTPETLPEEIITGNWNRPAGDASPELIRAALRKTNNNRSHAAELLGIGRTTLWRAMKKHGIE